MFPALPEEVERRVWRAYFRSHVAPQLAGRFVERWIEVRVGGSEWSSRGTAATVKFDRTNVVRLVEAVDMPFPCLQGEAEFAALVFGQAGGPREGYARRWTAPRSGAPYWYSWEDFPTLLPARTLLVPKRLSKFVQEGGKRRRCA